MNCCEFFRADYVLLPVCLHKFCTTSGLIVQIFSYLRFCVIVLFCHRLTYLTSMPLWKVMKYCLTRRTRKWMWH